MLSIKDLVFKKRLAKKLMGRYRYIRPYVVEEVISRNAVKLKLLASMRIHLVVNISGVMRFRELIKRQRVKKPKPVEFDGVEE